MAAPWSNPSLGEGAFLDDAAVGVGDLKARRDADPLNLPAEQARSPFAAS